MFVRRQQYPALQPPAIVELRVKCEDADFHAGLTFLRVNCLICAITNCRSSKFKTPNHAMGIMAISAVIVVIITRRNPTETVIIATYKGRGDIKNLTRGAEIFFKYAGDISLRYNDSITLGEARGKS